MKPAGGPLASPRTNLNARLRQALPDLPPHVALPASAIDAAIGVLLPADAENKLNARKLYLVLDLDETLVYAHKLEPGASPVGTLIHVRGTPYDLVKRPGLKFFMEMAHKNFVVSLYTMGDADYAQAVLRVIDPEGKYFRGAHTRGRIVAKPKKRVILQSRRGGVRIERRFSSPLFPHTLSCPRSCMQAARAAGGRASRGCTSRSRASSATAAWRSSLTTQSTSGAATLATSA